MLGEITSIAVRTHQDQWWERPGASPYGGSTGVAKLFAAQNKAVDALPVSSYPEFGWGTCGGTTGLPCNQGSGGAVAGAVKGSSGFSGLGSFGAIFGCSGFQLTLQRLKSALDAAKSAIGVLGSTPPPVQAAIDFTGNYGTFDFNVIYNDDACMQVTQECEKHLANVNAFLESQTPGSSQAYANLPLLSAQPKTPGADDFPFWAKALLIGGLAIAGLGAMGYSLNSIAKFVPGAR